MSETTENQLSDDKGGCSASSCSPLTEVRSWRGGNMEFGMNEDIAKPPWWLVRYRGMYWSRTEWCYDWIDYCGVPHIWLTRKRAEKRAKEFRAQYGGGAQFGNGPLKVEVVRFDP